MKSTEQLLTGQATVKELREHRAWINEQLHDIVRNAEKEGRGMTPEEEARFDRFYQDDKAVLEKVERQEKVEQLRAEKAAAEAEKEGRNALEVMPQTKEEREKAERLAFMKALTFRQHLMTPAEAQALQRLIPTPGGEPIRGTSTQITTTDSLGGYLIPQMLYPELERRMKWYGGILEACRILYTANGELITWPTVDDTSNTGTLHSEASPSIAVADLTFAEKQLGAYTRQSGIIKASLELMQDSYFDLEEEVMSLLAERLGRGVNYACTLDDGSSKPYGIVQALVDNSSLVNAADNTTLARTDLLNLEHGVDKAYRNKNVPNVGFMMNDAILKEIRALAFGSGDDRPLYQQSTRDGEPDRIEGHRFFINNDMASALANNAKTILFGDFSKFVVRIVRDVRVVTLRELYMASLQVGFIGWIRFDSELIQPNAIKALRMTNT